MGIYKCITIPKKNEDNEITSLIDKSNFNGFTEGVLELGDVGQKSKVVNALSVMFDLEGFTDFCKQIDPQLAVPEFLSAFLKWIFTEIKTELKVKEFPEGFETWAPLPFLSKFLGDGLLFLWQTDGLEEDTINNIVVTMYEICGKFETHFYKTVSRNISDVPEKLRCGIARGLIYSVGNGNDFVGPCINMSARLQKLNTLSFCFSRRGINPENMNETYSSQFITKKTNIRGIGDKEIVCFLKKEFDNLKEEDKKKFF